MRFFFYGTLIDPDVRIRVFGRGLAASCGVAPARLDGWRAAAILGESYPAAAPRRGSAAAGVLVDGLPGGVLPLLDAYEGPEYALRELAVVGDGGVPTVAAVVYVASPVCRVAGSDWDYSRWRRRHKRRFVAGLPAPGRLRGGFSPGRPRSGNGGS